ncbi:MAG: hypothetical protein KF802_02395 [Bdellovibrionaceae bacterium]|nr:hypothetical protein [Pseudobdellovibrionaceae bacterium]
MKAPLRQQFKALIRVDLPDGKTGSATTIPDWVDDRIKDIWGRDFLRFLLKRARVNIQTGKLEVVGSRGEMETECGISKTKIRELIYLLERLKIISLQSTKDTKSHNMIITFNEIEEWFKDVAYDNE